MQSFGSGLIAYNRLLNVSLKKAYYFIFAIDLLTEFPISTIIRITLH